MLFLAACGNDNGKAAETSPVTLNSSSTLTWLDSNAVGSSSNPSITDEIPTDEIKVDESNLDPLKELAAVQAISQGHTFLEGPVWSAELGELFFTDIPNKTIHKLTAAREVEVFASDQPGNGLTFDTNQNLIVAGDSARNIIRFSPDGSKTVIVSEIGGKKLNSPNDLIFDGDGVLYFTDPPYGLGSGVSETGCSGIYALRADGEVAELWCGSLESRPNGIAISADGKKLYVTFTDNGEIWEANLNTLSNNPDFNLLNTTSGTNDGLAIDTNGNLYVTTQSGVEVFSADGKKWGTIDVPEQPTNVAFGGTDLKTLYITARTSLYKLEVNIAGNG